MRNSLRNTIKRYVPCEISTNIKKLYVMRFWAPSATLAEMPLYNEYNECLRNYYLYDGVFAGSYSATFGRYPRYIYWDRYRCQLPYHFYTDDLLFTQKGKPVKKFGILLEPETLQPKKYNTIRKNPQRFSDYEIIFTHSEKILDTLNNAKPFIPGGVYIGTKYGGGTISKDQWMKKNKNISIVSSNKRWCKLHEYRYGLAQKYKKDERVDCYGTFNGKFVKIGDSLAEYRYSFAIENAIEPYWITERICNCFASMTVPIYLGSPKIGDYFNLDGIIVINENDYDNMDKIIAQCSEKDYMQRIDAIKDNFERVKNYYCMEDWLYNNYSALLPV